LRPRLLLRYLLRRCEFDHTAFTVDVPVAGFVGGPSVCSGWVLISLFEFTAVVELVVFDPLTELLVGVLGWRY
jgi:hypothetical protein